MKVRRYDNNLKIWPSNLSYWSVVWCDVWKKVTIKLTDQPTNWLTYQFTCQLTLSNPIITTITLVDITTSHPFPLSYHQNKRNTISCVVSSTQHVNMHSLIHIMWSAFCVFLSEYGRKSIHVYFYCSMSLGFLTVVSLLFCWTSGFRVDTMLVEHIFD